MLKICYRTTEGDDLSVLAHDLLDQACLAEGLSSASDKIMIAEGGKPYIEGNPVYFNLSHSGNTALCVLSDHPVGCDIERVRRRRESVVRKFFHEDEENFIYEAPDPEEENRRYTRIWVLREAFLKWTGEGLKRDMRTFHFSFERERACIHLPEGEEAPKLYEMELEDGYLVAVCYRD